YDSVPSSDGMAADSRRQGSAAIGQRRDGRIIIAKIRISRKEPMFLAEIAIQSEVGLILIVRLGASEDEVIGAGDIRQWVVLEDLSADRIKALCRYGVVLELSSRRG